MQARTWKTLDIFGDTNIPITAAWNLSDLTEAQDKQQRFTKQLPQLKELQNRALIESQQTTSL